MNRKIALPEWKGFGTCQISEVEELYIEFEK